MQNRMFFAEYKLEDSKNDNLDKGANLNKSI